MDECQGSHPASADDTPTRKFSRRCSVRNHCQVDGCTSRLKRVYCRRFHVCHAHATAGSVLLQGQQSRFCQRCGKFHDLDAFDGSKRNCRAGLAQHNSSRRTRRQQKHAAAASSHGGKTSSTHSSSNPSSGSSSDADSMESSDDDEDDQ
ncbi:hypothetical protein OEZ85_007737 [Tetradesmus obliquus]|uniref:SBP-type domain-containing protein n=1 Tax=Tetradesmus obliquus TaxID=3088 RepID=A0ABY8TGU5_TETOB|nr:hypothetical protein OEZ85_007737 [Tetradesmus obliquus]